MVAGNNRGLLVTLLGSPFALIGLIFLLKGRFGVGFAFLMLGLAPFLLGAGGTKTPPSSDGASIDPNPGDADDRRGT